MAKSKGWIQVNPYEEIKYREEKVEKPYLTEEELNVIINKKISIERLSVIRDVFLFCCYTGLAFTDVKELKMDNIKHGIDGNKWVFKYRHKTDVESTVPLLEPAKNLIAKYNTHPFREIEGLVFPVPSNQKMNAYLKEIADICGIEKILTTHTARRTFATIMLQNRMSMEAVSKMLGHTSLYMTKRYAKITEQLIANDFKNMNNNFLTGTK